MSLWVGPELSNGDWRKVDDAENISHALRHVPRSLLLNGDLTYYVAISNLASLYPLQIRVCSEAAPSNTRAHGYPLNHVYIADARALIHHIAHNLIRVLTLELPLRRVVAVDTHAYPWYRTCVFAIPGLTMGGREEHSELIISDAPNTSL